MTEGRISTKRNSSITNPIEKEASRSVAIKKKRKHAPTRSPCFLDNDSQPGIIFRFPSPLKPISKKETSSDSMQCKVIHYPILLCHVKQVSKHRSPSASPPPAQPPSHVQNAIAPNISSGKVSREGKASQTPRSPASAKTPKKQISERHSHTKQCRSCKTLNSPQGTWRQGWKSSVLLCNSCGLRYRSSKLFCKKCHYIPTKREVGSKCVKCTTQF